MRRRRPHAFTLSWLDMLMSQLGVFAFLFIVAFALIKPADQKPGVEMKAEYLVVLTWPKGSLDDIDLHLLLPDRTFVDFHHREVGFALLDHDDLGVNGIYTGPDGKPTRLDEHKEVISLRARVPGTYVANVHVFRINASYGQFESNPPLPYTVKVTLIRLNPTYEEVASVEVPLAEIGQQKTAFAFSVEPDGLVRVDRDADVPFITTAPPGLSNDR